MDQDYAREAVESLSPDLDAGGLSSRLAASAVCETDSNAALALEAQPGSKLKLDLEPDAEPDAELDHHVSDGTATLDRPTVPHGSHSTITERAIALELWNQGLPLKNITEHTGIKKQTFYALLRKARSRGFNRGDRVLVEHVTDGRRTGRPQAIDDAMGQQILETLHSSSPTTRQLRESVQETCGRNIGRMTLLRFLKKTGHSAKSTRQRAPHVDGEPE